MTNDQARNIYKKVESESLVNVDIIKQEIEDDKIGRKNIGDEEVSPYHAIITNNIDKENTITSQMEQ